MSADYVYDPSAPDNLTGLLKTLEAGDHTTSSADWHALLQEAHPACYSSSLKRIDHDDSYDEPADVPESVVALTRKDRVDALELRHSLGQSLYHPGDVLHDMREDLVIESVPDQRNRRTGREVLRRKERAA